MKALYEKLLNPETMTKLPELVDVCERRVKSSIEAFDSGHFAKLITDMEGTKPKVVLLPGELAKDNSWIYNQDKTLELMNELFPPETTEKN